MVAERNNLVNEGTATWSGAPDIGEPTLTARSSQNWASSYKLEHNDAVFPDKHWEEIKHAKPELYKQLEDALASMSVGIESYAQARGTSSENTKKEEPKKKREGYLK